MMPGVLAEDRLAGRPSRAAAGRRTPSSRGGGRPWSRCPAQRGQVGQPVLAWPGGAGRRSRRGLARASRSGRPAHFARSRWPACACPARKRRASSLNALVRGRRRRPAQPVPGQHVGGPPPAIGPRTAIARRQASRSSWTSAWPSVRTPAAAIRSRSCGRVSGPSAASASLDDRDGLVRVRRRDALLGQPPGVGKGQPRREQRLQPPVVLAADQVQGAAVQPGDQQRAVLRQRPVHVGRGQPGRAHPDGQPGAARVLGLDGQQPPGHRLGAARGLPGQQLRREPLRDHARPRPALTPRALAVQGGHLGRRRTGRRPPGPPGPPPPARPAPPGRAAAPSAPRASASRSRRLVPISGMMSGPRDSAQAKASWAGVAPISPAIFSTAASRARLRRRFSPWNRGNRCRGGRRPDLAGAGAEQPAGQHPVGGHADAELAGRRAARWASIPRLISEYSICRPLTGCTACARRMVVGAHLGQAQRTGRSPPGSARRSRRPCPRSAPAGRAGRAGTGPRSRCRAGSGCRPASSSPPPGWRRGR